MENKFDAPVSEYTEYEEYEYWANEFENGFSDRDELSERNYFVLSRHGDYRRTMNFSSIVKMIRYLEYAVLCPIACDALNIKCGEFASKDAIAEIFTLSDERKLTASQENICQILSNIDTIAEIAEKADRNAIALIVAGELTVFKSEAIINGVKDIAVDIFHSDDEYIFGLKLPFFAENPKEKLNGNFNTVIDEIVDFSKKPFSPETIEKIETALRNKDSKTFYKLCDYYNE